MVAETWPIARYRNGAFEHLNDPVVPEVPLTVYVNGREVVTLLSLGEHPVELAVGFLRSEGFLAERTDLAGWTEEPGVVRVEVSRDVEPVFRLLEKRTVTTGCGKGTTFYRSLDALRCRPLTGPARRFEPETLLARMADLQERSGLYRETGGTHNASVADGDGTVLFRSDIGRHNAVDMIGGRAFLDRIDLGGTFLVTTGRISSEILVKTAKMGVPVIVSRSAPTVLALELARDLGVTVAGYARGRRFNLYTHPHRVGGAEAGASGPGGGCRERTVDGDLPRPVARNAQPVVAGVPESET